LASALREAFSLVGELDKVVLFIDEVEEIAGMRQSRAVSAAQGVTNEMLKLILGGQHGRHPARHQPDPAHPDSGVGGRVRAGHQGLRQVVMP
jgi:hypothetical protein